MDALAEIKSHSTKALTSIERFIPNSLPINQKGAQRIFRFVRDLDDLSKQNLLTGAFVIGITLGSLLFIHQPPKTEAEFSTHQTTSEKLVVEQIVSAEDQLFKNFSQQEKVDFDKKINERLKDYREHDPKRAQRVLDNWESTIDAIVNTYVPAEKRQFWKDVLTAVLYIEGSGHPVKDINKPTPKSVAGARGPAQLTEDAFYETADKHPEVYSYNPKTKERYIDPDNGFTSIRVAYLRLSDLLDVFKNLNLSLGGYYAGETFVRQRIPSALEKMGTNNKDLLNAVNLGSEDVLKYNVDFAAALRDIEAVQTAKNTAIARR